MDRNLHGVERDSITIMRLLKLFPILIPLFLHLRIIISIVSRHLKINNWKVFGLKFVSKDRSIQRFSAPFEYHF